MRNELKFSLGICKSGSIYPEKLNEAKFIPFPSGKGIHAEVYAGDCRVSNVSKSDECPQHSKDTYTWTE